MAREDEDMIFIGSKEKCAEPETVLSAVILSKQTDDVCSQ
jgi:hypothetical protein